jgi:O-antigen ligase
VKINTLIMRKITLWLSLCLIFSIPWENAITIEEIGTLTRVIGIAAFISWAISIMIDRCLRSLHIFHFMSSLFICWNILSFYWSIGSDQSVRQIITLIQLTAMAWMMLDLYCSSENLRMALEAYVLGAYVSVFGSLMNFVEGQTISMYEKGRFTGAGINAVELTIILSIALACSWYLATTTIGNSKREKLLRIIYFCFCPLAIFSILISGSRTGVFALAPAFLYIGFSLGKLKRVYKLILAAFGIGVLLYITSLIPTDTAERLLSVEASIRNFDLGGRGELWLQSIDIFLGHPIIGIGSGALLAEEMLGEVAHNTFLSVLTELGLIGLIIFVSMLVIVGHQAAVGLKKSMEIWIVLLATWTIGCMSLSWELTKTTWLIMSLIIASGRLVNQQKYTG